MQKGQARCRQVCDLFKKLEGNEWGMWGRREGEGGRKGLAVVAMEMTRNASVAPGCPHRLIGSKPRPVPSTVLPQIPRS